MVVVGSLMRHFTMQYDKGWDRGNGKTPLGMRNNP